ncbi:hypothetical protein [Flaviaesturariibacter amylovorans]|uniref:Uncharacterized protein n=1 Tax=Flaviaesturariibacter amylovorans TaxID=1084520 RepID=A0ABP8GQ47_9BACT
MQKQEFKEQVFILPLKHKIVRDLKIVEETIGELHIGFVGYFDPSASPIDVYERYSVDLESVAWNGADVKDLLAYTEKLDDIEEATIRHFARQHDASLTQTITQ